MQKREKVEKREVCCGPCVNENPPVKPVDFDVDFEGLAMAWKQVNESSERRR